MGMNDCAIKQEEERYQGYGDYEIDYLQEMKDKYQYEKNKDISIDNLVDEWLERQKENRCENIFWEVDND